MWNGRIGLLACLLHEAPREARITEPDAGDSFFLDVNWGDGTPASAADMGAILDQVRRALRVLQLVAGGDVSVETVSGTSRSLCT